MILSIMRKFELLKSQYRIFLGMCPLCNSDAPELDTCPMCQGRHSAKGDSFPPSQLVKDMWGIKYRAVINAKYMIKNHVNAARKSRNKAK